jgi:hypothetical protein
MASFLADVRFALRLLWKNRGFTAIAVLVLAVGIGANSAVFTIVNTMLLKPRVGNPPGPLVSLFNRDTTKPDSYRAFSFATFDELRRRQDAFASLSAHNLAMVGLREGDATRRLFVDIVTKDFFNTFGAPPALGRAFTADEERPGADVPVAVISHALWQRLGGRETVLGQTITLNNRAFTVIGIAQRGFGGSIVMLTPDAFVPTGVYDSLQNDFGRDGLTTKLSDPRHFNLFLAAQLRPGATIESVSPILKVASAQLAAADPANLKDRETIATPMSRLSISTSPQDDEELLPMSAILLGLSLVVLFMIFNLCQAFGVYGFANWVPALLVEKGITVTKSLQYSFIIAFAYPIAPLLAASFADRLERKWIICGACVAMCPNASAACSPKATASHIARLEWMARMAFSITS